MIRYFRNAFIIGFLSALSWAAVAWVYMLIFEAFAQRPMVEADWMRTVGGVALVFGVGVSLIAVGLTVQSYADAFRYLRDTRWRR